MRRIASFLVVAVLASVLSGCVAPSTVSDACAETACPDDGAGLAVAFDEMIFDRCTGVGLFAVVPDAWAEPHVPDGWLQSDSGVATLHGHVLSCDNVVYGNVTHGVVAFSLIGLRVEPPDASDADEWWVVSMTITDASLANVLVASGVPAVVGTVAMSDAVTPAPSVRYQVERDDGGLELVVPTLPGDIGEARFDLALFADEDITPVPATATLSDVQGLPRPVVARADGGHPVRSLLGADVGANLQGEEYVDGQFRFLVAADGGLERPSSSAPSPSGSLSSSPP